MRSRLAVASLSYINPLDSARLSGHTQPMTPVRTIDLENLRMAFKRVDDMPEADPQGWARMLELRAMVRKLLEAVPETDVVEIPRLDLSKPASEQGL